MKNILIASPHFTQDLKNLIPSMAIGSLPSGLAYHADLQAHFLSKTELLVCPECFDYYKKMLPDIHIIKGFSSLGRTYEKHSAYNIARISNFAFHNTRYTDPVAKEYFSCNGISLIHVNQGYTKCSVAIISKNAIITSDTGIYNAARDVQIDALLCRPGFIELEGYNYGFIGGSCGLLDSKTIFFTGSLSSHPDGAKIYDFITSYGVKIIEGHRNSIYDIGSILQNTVF